MQAYHPFTATHAETASHFNLGPCDVVQSDWPYPCDAKTKHPRDLVYVCRAHSVWWHGPAKAKS